MQPASSGSGRALCRSGGQRGVPLERSNRARPQTSHPASPPACAAGYGNWYDAPLPLVQGGSATYFGASIPFDLGTLAAIEFAAMAGAESFRGAAEPEKRVYPGGPFDPAGMVSLF